MKRIFLTIISLCILFLIVSTSCSKNVKKKDKDKKEETIFAVNTTKVIKGEINDFIELNGDVKAKTEVSIYPDVMGKLSRININLGDNVYKNQTIAYIDPSKPGMDFNLSPVRSTITGTITSLPFEVGSTVSPQTAVAKVGKLDELEIITYISEKYISKIKIGLDSIIKTQAFPGQKFNASVSEISPVVDPVSRMLELKLKLKDKDKKLLPGLFVEIKIITEKKNDIVKIPSECIVRRYGKYYVFVVNRTSNEQGMGVVKKVEVTLGIQIENKIEIVSGLYPDEEIVYTGQSLLEDDAKVKIVNTYQPLTKNDVVE